MAEVLLFHHALGLTAGCRAFADELRAVGHVVHTPDLFEGRTFGSVPEGVRHAEQLGFDTVTERGMRAAEALPARIVLAGFSLGVMPAQRLAQTRPGAAGALLVHGSVPLPEFGGTWPDGVPLQIHTMADDELGDVDVAHELVAAVAGAQLHLYPGEGHLFTDPGSPDHDPEAAALVMRRALAFLHVADRRG
ncbi:dienelactone hydrolase family protein [Pseudonocardia zijingensis]|uniref:Dienelactone hydrolase family protein n=1 Tax=Pseudonocardia zijingensis TaxID=153376 RepID=A0ABP4B082_9PSEU